MSCIIGENFLVQNGLVKESVCGGLEASTGLLWVVFSTGLLSRLKPNAHAPLYQAILDLEIFSDNARHYKLSVELVCVFFTILKNRDIHCPRDDPFILFYKSQQKRGTWFVYMVIHKLLTPLFCWLKTLVFIEYLQRNMLICVETFTGIWVFFSIYCWNRFLSSWINPFLINNGKHTNAKENNNNNKK